MKVAITGGIGAGKSYVCRLLEQRGIRIYDCDREAKRLMRSSRDIRSKLCSLVGSDVYQGNQLQKRILAEFLLESEANAARVNDIVHPAVAADFELSGMDWLESAILFDSGFNRRIYIDKVVCVAAPLEVRISRIMQRDGISRAKALEWIGRQLPQEEVASHSDFVITNDGCRNLDEQIDAMLRCFL